MTRLADKIALITGVGGGMGVAAARRFAAEGARVVGCDLDVEGAARTEALVRAEGGDITVMGGVDLGDAEAARAWVDAAVATYDGIDVLYNNASTQRFRTVVLDRIPLGRHGQPEDVVNAAVFLASDESSWISGTNIVIDGGASVLG